MNKKFLLFLFLICRVSAWTTVTLTYRICDKDYNETVNFETTYIASYGTSNYYGTNGVNGSTMSLVLLGCTSDCKLTVKVPLDDKDHTILATYQCSQSGYFYNPTVQTHITYDGSTPNPDYPVPPVTTYLIAIFYKINVDTGGTIEIADTLSIGDAIDSLTGQSGDKGIRSFLNIATKDYTEFKYNSQETNVANLVQSVLHFLDYHSATYESILYAYQELDRIMNSDMVPDLTPKKEVNTNLIEMLLAFGISFVLVEVDPFLAPFVAAADEAILIANEFKKSWSDVINNGTNSVDPSKNTVTNLKDLGFIENDAETNMLGSLQSFVESCLNSSIGDSNWINWNQFSDYDGTKTSPTNMGNGLFKILEAHYASIILNYYDVVVCSPDSASRVCESESYCCVENAITHNCQVYFKCNDPVGAPTNCIFEGGFGNGRGGIDNDYLVKLGKYGNLNDACQVVNGQNVNGWNLRMDNCANYQRCF
ncbi:5559_t:CDS:1 [Acaulospora morrowiae]|uniref:5559_t:CDS:1 n=1 Tax=Acaulospora morrowiae TaxID=94023 RepID=A0A9N9A486_9GLOM|nr:5559_t:CDS:1 [Acaulospora morrowiae]